MTKKPSRKKKVPLSHLHATKKSACGNKRPFETLEAARGAMLSFKRRKASVSYLAAYKCRWCSKFHWGNALTTGDTRMARKLSAIDRALERDTRLRREAGQGDV